MKRILLAICMMAMSALSYGQSNRVSFTFAWLSDVHLNSFAYAEDDLRQSIEDINANPAVDFAILSGDVTEFGDTKEFLLLQEQNGVGDEAQVSPSVCSSLHLLSEFFTVILSALFMPKA